MQLSRYIDHTLLKPQATAQEIIKLCEEAQAHSFFSVCVNSSRVALCAKTLKNSTVKVCSVVGFPLGAMSTSAKAFETEKAISDGATEIDMVINVGALKDGDLQFVTEDIKAVVSAAKGHTVKVIIETSLLNQDEKVLACKCALEAKAHFVKTSTGFSTGGATLADVTLMKQTVGNLLEVKASGGIKDSSQALAMIEAGASRLGTSSGITIIEGGTVKGGY